MSLESAESVPHVTAELLRPSSEAWEQVKQDVMTLEEACFPGKGFGEEYLKEKFEDPESIIALLKRNEEIIGFSYATPDEKSEDAAYIDTTEIRPEEQGQRQVLSLMNLIEAEAKRRGFKFITRNAAVENGYADKIAKNYVGRILETHENDSEWGTQRYFKIAL